MEMPPSPALRFSPRRELKVDNHKRGHSFESGLIRRDKDDDLALFNEMQSREHDDFLLSSTDDFEDAFSTKLRYFSDYKHGISVPVGGESAELLNVDAEKNDYDWLLTPPDTPLFPSLDDETTALNLPQRGRPRSQPISISRSSTMEKGYRSSRGSPSPHRLSPSPQSKNSIIQPRGRPSSARQSSPIPSIRNSSPSMKPSTPGPRSSSPTPRRLSTGSSSTSAMSSQVRGTSPVSTNRENSSSPKVRAWQSNIPGFSSEVPPNLRTSLADRPASYVRGSSPASSKVSRQSMSPTASRSVSSSHSQDKDRFGSNKGGSVASYGDDDIESLQSVLVGSADRSTSRKVISAYGNNRVLGSSKKTGRLVSSSSVPKKSFDYAMRQMDNRKTPPPNMFRPLLSSVPSTTFYTGKASSSSGHRTIISRNSSITTSSNTSSDQGTSVLIDTEASSVHNQNNCIASEDNGKVFYPDSHVDEVFVFDKDDEKNLLHGDQDQNMPFEIDHDKSETFSHNGDDMEIIADVETCAALDPIQPESNCIEIDGVGDKMLCSTCGCHFFPTEYSETDTKLCPDCSREDEILSIKHFENNELSKNPVPSIDETTQNLEIADIGKPKDFKFEENIEQDDTRIVDQQEIGQLNDYSLSSKFSNTEGTGISILLKRSSSSKGHVIQGRTFTASAIPYDNLLYARDSTNSMRSRGSVSSTSSSIDLASIRKTDIRVQRQLSGKKSDTENYRYDIKSIDQSTTGSSCSVISNHVEEEQPIVACNNDQEFSLEKNYMNESYSSKGTILEENNIESSETCRIIDTSTSESSSNFPDNPESVLIEEEDTMSMTCVNGVDVATISTQNALGSISEIEIENIHPDSCSERDLTVSSNSKNEVDVTQESSFSQLNLETCADIIIEETTMLGNGQRESKSRSLTLEETTDTILFCSSIVHNLAYKAAAIAVEKHNSTLLEEEGLRPTITTIPKKPFSDPLLANGSKPRLKAHKKAREKRMETDKMKKQPENEVEDEMKINEPLIRNVGLPKRADNTRPPKLESKCNCAIM